MGLCGVIGPKTMAAAVADPPNIDGGDVVTAMAHGAIDQAFIRRIGEMWGTLLRDTRAHDKTANAEVRKRFITGYQIAVHARREAHELIDQYRE